MIDTGTDALAWLADLLKSYGLDSLTTWAWQQLQAGHSQTQIALDLPNQAAYKERFGTVIDARRAAGLPPVSPGEIVAYENTWNQIARANGLPEGFGTRDIAQQLMAANVSVAEAQARVQNGYAQMIAAPIEVRAAFDTFFGAKSDAALAAFFTDPELSLPDLERQVAEAQIAGAGAQQGFGNIDEALARRLANQGISAGQAQQGFGHLAAESSLFNRTVGEEMAGGGVTAEEGVSAEFGLSGSDAEKVRRASAQRQADFGGYGSTAVDQSGLTGAGSARQV